MRLFKIGEFAELACVSVRLLRHYEDKGLIKPVEIDPRSSYRYYSLEQLKPLNMILRLRNLGIPLNKISEVISGDTGTKIGKAVLQEQLAQLAQEALQTAEKLQCVAALIAEFENQDRDAKETPVLSATLKSVPQVEFFQTRQKAESTKDMERAIHDFYGSLRRQGVTRSRLKFATMFHELDLPAKKIDWCYGVLDPVPKVAVALSTLELKFEPVHLPPVKNALSVVHSGPFARLEHLYERLATWLADHPYEISGPVRHYHHQIRSPRSGDDNITEIIAPIQRIVERTEILKWPP